MKTLTRQVADSLTPPNSPNESGNIEQELLDVLRGHKVVSKTTRRSEKKLDEQSEENFEEKQSDKSSTKKRTRTSPNVDVQKSTEAFS